MLFSLWNEQESCSVRDLVNFNFNSWNLRYPTDRNDFELWLEFGDEILSSWKYSEIKRINKPRWYENILKFYLFYSIFILYLSFILFVSLSCTIYKIHIKYIYTYNSLKMYGNAECIYIYI